MTEKKRFPQIDVLYTIGTMLVILGHSHYSDWSLILGTPIEAVIGFIYTFHMPLFFFIAGFLFMNSNKIERVGYGKWIGEKAIKLLTPYFVLSIIAIVPKYYLESHNFFGFAGYSIKAIFVPRVGVWGHFWFLPVIFFVYALFGLWKKYVYQINEKFVLSITVVLSIVIYFIPFSTDWFGIGDIKKEILFFVFGMLFYFAVQNFDLKFNKLLYFATALVLFVVSVTLYHFFKNNLVCMLLIALIMIYSCWCFSCFIGKTKPTSWISVHNFAIYIYSWLFQSVVMMVCQRFALPWYLATIAMFISGLAFPMIIAIVYEKCKKINNKFFDLLLGVK